MTPQEELRRQVRLAHQFRSEVVWLSTPEACAVMADLLENPQPPLSNIYVEKFLEWSPVLLPVPKCEGRIRDLSEHERKRLAKALRSHCKPVEYMTEPTVWPVAA